MDIPATFTARKQNYTVDEYLDEESKTLAKLEYCDGVISEKRGLIVNRVRIATDTMCCIHNLLDATPYHVYGPDMRVKTSTDFYAYVDAVVNASRGNFEFRREMHTMTDPLLMAEVVVPNSGYPSREYKYENFRSIKSLQDYLIISQEQIQVDHYYRQASDDWNCKTLTHLEDHVLCQGLFLKIPLSEIYDRVDFDGTTIV